MVNFYTAKENFRKELKKLIEELIEDQTTNAGDGRLLLGSKDIKALNEILLTHGFSTRILHNEIKLFGLIYDEEKAIMKKV